MTQNLSDWLKQKPDHDSVLSKIIQEPDLIERLLTLIETDLSSIKFQADKILQSLSLSDPELVYPFFDRIATHIHSTNHFIQWGSLITLSHLIPFDQGQAFMKVILRYWLWRIALS